MSEVNEATQIKMAIEEMHQALLKQDPNMPGMLRQIHKQLAANPDCVTLLSEEEIAKIMAGLQKFTNAMLVTDSVKTSSKSGKSAKAVMSAMGNLDDAL